MSRKMSKYKEGLRQILANRYVLTILSHIQLLPFVKAISPYCALFMAHSPLNCPVTLPCIKKDVVSS